MSDVDNDMPLTIGRLIALLQTVPPETRIGYVDFTGYDEIDVYVNDNGEAEIGPK